MGAPYALSSDLVSAWPAKSLEVAQYIDGQVPLIAMTQNAQTGTTYTLAATDFTKLVTLSNASPVTVTVPLQSSVAWVAGTQLRLLNLGAGLVTVVGAGGVTINGNVSLKQYQGGTLIRTASDVWLFVPTVSGTASDTTSVNTLQTTSSSTFTDLATAGPAVTLTTGTKALVIISTHLYNSGNSGTLAGFAVSGASTVAAANEKVIELGGSGAVVSIGVSRVFLQTGLTAGSNTFTMKYRVGGGTGTFYNRAIAVIDMGS